MRPTSLSSATSDPERDRPLCAPITALLFALLPLLVGACGDSAPLQPVMESTDARASADRPAATCRHVSGTGNAVSPVTPSPPPDAFATLRGDLNVDVYVVVQDVEPRAIASTNSESLVFSGSREFHHWSAGEDGNGDRIIQEEEEEFEADVMVQSGPVDAETGEQPFTARVSITSGGSGKLTAQGSLNFFTGEAEFSYRGRICGGI